MEILSKLLTEIVEASGIIIGAVLAILGGIAATWYRARKTRQIRIDEIMAEKQVEANREAHKRIELLRSSLMQQCNREVLKYMDDRIAWILDRRPYLPALFYNNWMSIRASLREATILEGTLEELKGPQQRTGPLDKLHKYKPHCEKLAGEALAELERIMDLEPVELKYPSESK